MDIADYYRSLPPFTRYYITAVIVLAFLSTFNIVSYGYFILFFEQAIWSLQIWRFLTCFCFFGNFSFFFLMALLHIGFSVRNCEQSFEEKDIHNFWFMLVFFLLAITGLSWLFNAHYLMGTQLTFAMIWVFAQKSPPENTASLWGFHFSIRTFPWILLIFNLLMGQSIQSGLIGLAVGHLYYYLTVELPRLRGVRLLWTPQWFKMLVFRLANQQMPRWQQEREEVLRVNRAFAGRGVRLGGE